MEYAEKFKLKEELDILTTEFPNSNFSVPKFQETLLEMLMREPPNHFPYPYKSQKVAKKSVKVSVVCCVMGEKAFAAGDYNDALKNFTNALRLAPASSQIIAYSYFWRSVVLQKLKAYSDSLKDIQRALTFPITEKQKENLLDRKKVIENLQPRESNEEESHEEEEKEVLSYGENAEIKGASCAVDLVYNEKYGRHFIATRDIKIEDVLFILAPYSFATVTESNNEKKGRHWCCENCLDLTMAPIPCDSCAMLLYCSDKCKFEAYEKYHKYECKIAQLELPVVPLGSMTTLFLRSFLILTKQGEDFQEIVKLVDVINKRKDRRTAGFKDGKLENSSEAVLSLFHHMDKNNFLGIVNVASEIACALKKDTDFFKKGSDIQSLAKLLVLLSYICINNMSCVQKDERMNVTGVGLYPVFNLLNHNCSCNILFYNDKRGNMILRACKDIEKGEQLFISYNLLDIMDMTAEERIHLYQKARFFTCECEACKNNYTYKFELEGTQTGDVLQEKLRMNPADKDNLWQCLKFVFKMHKGPCLEGKMLEVMIENAYLGSSSQFQDFPKQFR